MSSSEPFVMESVTPGVLRLLTEVNDLSHLSEHFEKVVLVSRCRTKDGVNVLLVNDSAGT